MTDHLAPKPPLLATDPSDPGSPMQSVRSPSVDSEDFVQGYLLPVHKAAPRLDCSSSQLREKVSNVDVHIPDRLGMAAGSIHSGENHQVSCELDFAGSPKLPGMVLWVWSNSVDNVLAPLPFPTSLLPSPHIVGNKYAMPGEWKEFTPPLSPIILQGPPQDLLYPHSSYTYSHYPVNTAGGIK
ncbi:hypothetical protein BDN67DRAFT_984740 [Paxillus ammoniavirescens]|nr:hypothetical protein BDN67DRAFT_984740 [Paxillus ammoniavirescens]